jgi:nucleotide-binding universal stress UspA family protein
MPLAVGTILVAYDGSPISKKAVERASTLLVKEDDSMVLLYVVPDAASTGTLGEMVCPEDAVSDEDAHLLVNHAAMSVVEHRGLQAVGFVRRGSPGEVIVRVAGEMGASVVVVGVGRVEKVSCFALGSVAEYVARHCGVPVLIVR